MNIFRKKKFNISEKDTTYRVVYLGNVHTTMMKGEGCVDKPVSVLWNNYIQNSSNGTEMKLTICAFGMHVRTKTQGSTEYRAHRISYCIAHPGYPKLFLWVYRHEGRKMKVDSRCHAVLCSSESKAKAMAVLLNERISVALQEFLREKNKTTRTRLVLQRTNSLPVNGGTDSPLPLRTRMLSTAHNFRPNSDKLKLLSLNAITEDKDGEEIMEEEEEDDIEQSVTSVSPSTSPQYIRRRPSRESLTNLTAIIEDKELDNSDVTKQCNFDEGVCFDPYDSDFLTHPIGDSPEGSESSSPDLLDSLNLMSDTLMDFEMGNNIDDLLKDSKVQDALENPESDDDDDDLELKDSSSVGSDTF